MQHTAVNDGAVGDGAAAEFENLHRLALNVERKKPRAQTLPEVRGLLRRRVFRSDGNVRVGFRGAELSGETQAPAARYNFGEMLIAAKYGILHAVFGRIGEERHGALGALCSFPLAGEVVQAFGGEVPGVFRGHRRRFRGFLFVYHAFCWRLSR